MVSVHDVAAYILAQKGQMTCVQLQKLVFYSQAWSMVWDGEPLFPQDVQAWVGGPVVYELFEMHRGRYRIADWPAGNGAALSAEQRKTVDAVLVHYGPMTPYQLSELTHGEAPWIDARRGLAPSERGRSVISLDAMGSYYGSLQHSK